MTTDGDRSPARMSMALVGFMGSGKSCIGMAVASRLRLPFIDTDALIAEQHGPIDRIFAERGESHFRRMERQVVVPALERAVELPCILSLGGGAVMSADVRASLVEIAHVVWLQAPAQVLFRRASGGGRPLATDEVAFCELLERREALYAEVANVRVANDGSRSPAEVAEDVIDRCAATEGSG